MQYNLGKLENTILQVAANVLEEDNTTITKEKALNAINELEQRTTFVRNSWLGASLSLNEIVLLIIGDLYHLALHVGPCNDGTLNGAIDVSNNFYGADKPMCFNKLLEKLEEWVGVIRITQSHDGGLLYSTGVPTGYQPEDSWVGVMDKRLFDEIKK